MIKKKAKEKWLTSKEIVMLASFLMMIDMVRESDFIEMEMYSKERIKMILDLDLEKWFIKMGMSMRENGRILIDMAKARLDLQMGVWLRVFGRIMYFKNCKAIIL